MMKCCTKCLLTKELQEFYNKSCSKDGKTSACKSCVNERNNNWKKKNKDKFDAYQKKYSTARKVKKAEYDKEYRKKNRKRINEYFVKRNKDDILFRLTSNLRKRNHKYIARKGYVKSDKLIPNLGCTLTELKIHLEKQFSEGMSWDNYGKWHIDHKKPLCTATTSRDVYELNHYSNLQPVWGEENISKNGKWDGNE